jgi:hypothetical protein
VIDEIVPFAEPAPDPADQGPSPRRRAVFGHVRPLPFPRESGRGWSCPSARWSASDSSSS